MTASRTMGEDNGQRETATAHDAPTEGHTGVRRSVIHVGLSVRGALAWPDKMLRNLVSDENGDRLSPREVREWLMDHLSQGTEMLPMGKCSDFDPKTGCRGHAPVSPKAGATEPASDTTADNSPPPEPAP